MLPLPDGASLITIDAAGEIRAWRVDAADGAAGRRLGEAAAPDAVSVSNDGKRLAYPTGRGDIVVRDVASGARLGTLPDGASGAAAGAVAGAAPEAAGAAVRLHLAPDGSRLVAASGERARLWSVPSEPAGAERAADLELTALDVDRARAVIALGFRSGQSRFSDAAGAARAAAAASGIDYFGHRGAVSAVAVDAARGVAVTGGADGIVRVWDLATAEPVPPVLPHAIENGGETVVAVALSPDARWIASAAAGTVRLWSAADGVLATELPFSGSSVALAFAHDGSVLAIGDRSGSRLMSVAPNAGSTRTLAARAAVTSIAFAPGGELFASGDAAGNLQLARVATGETVGAARTLASAVRWVGFGGDGVLLAVTDAWAHSFSIGAGELEPRRTRRLPFSQVPAIAVVAAEPERVRVAGFDALGTLGYAELDLGAPPGPSAAPPPEVFERDWPSALGLRLDDAGEPTASSP